MIKSHESQSNHYYHPFITITNHDQPLFPPKKSYRSLSKIPRAWRFGLDGRHDLQLRAGAARELPEDGQAWVFDVKGPGLEGQLDGKTRHFMGKSMEKLYLSWENRWFPVQIWPYTLVV